jgi:hypothetical protein
VLDSASSTGQSRTAKLSQVKSQYGTIKVASTAGFDGVVDVAASRKALTTASDSATFTITNPTTTGWLTTVATAGTKVNLHADLAGFDLVKGNGSVTTGASSKVAYDDAAKMVSITYTGEVTTDTITITPPVDSTTAKTEAVILNAQDFMVEGSYTYGTAGVAALGKVAAGEWTLNGAVVSVPYMPYSANASQILYVTNTGSLDADISVTAIDDKGMMYDLGKVGVAGKGAVTKITKEVGDALTAAGFAGGKVAMTITVNAQDKDITVYASYNVGGADRGYINTSQYKGK